MQTVYCRNCGQKIDAAVSACPHCNALKAPSDVSSVQPTQATSGSGMQYILPIGRSGWSIAAGYLALFSILLLPAPLALFCGGMALRDIAKHPEKTGKPRAIFGIIMGLIGSGLLATLLLKGRG